MAIINIIYIRHHCNRHQLELGSLYVVHLDSFEMELTKLLSNIKSCTLFISN